MPVISGDWLDLPAFVPADVVFAVADPFVEYVGVCYGDGAPVNRPDVDEWARVE